MVEQAIQVQFLMNCIPALIAGVKEIYMTVPCLNGQQSEYCMQQKCKVKKIFKLGGAQAVAALAFGTKTVNKVDKIVGPGNEYVALAKKEVSGVLVLTYLLARQKLLLLQIKTLIRSGFQQI